MNNSNLATIIAIASMVFSLIGLVYNHIISKRLAEELVQAGLRIDRINQRLDREAADRHRTNKAVHDAIAAINKNQ